MRKCCIGASLVESMYYWYLDDILKYRGETEKYDIGSKYVDIFMKTDKSRVENGEREFIVGKFYYEKGEMELALNDYMDKLALSKDWGNRNTVKVARIPAGIEVKYAVGTAREQLLIADPRPGGGVQYLFNQFDTDWITEIRSFSN